MRLFTIQQTEQLKTNGSDKNFGKDHVPVVKLFLPGSGCTWLLTETDTEYPHIAFGLCDLGFGFPELGSVDLEEIMSVKSKMGLYVEKDLHFNPKYPISVYARAAQANDCIVEDDIILQTFLAQEKRKYLPE